MAALMENVVETQLYTHGKDSNMRRHHQVAGITSSAETMLYANHNTLFTT